MAIPQEGTSERIFERIDSTRCFRFTSKLKIMPQRPPRRTEQQIVDVTVPESQEEIVEAVRIPHRSGEPKRSPHEGGPQWLFSTFKRFLKKKQTFFHDAHIGYGSVVWASWHFTHEPFEPLWARNMRPLRLPEPCHLAQTLVVVCKASGPPVLGYASDWVLGPTVLGHTCIPRSQLEGLVGTRFALVFKYFLVLGQYFRIVVIMTLTILATTRHRVYEL